MAKKKQRVIAMVLNESGSMADMKSGVLSGFKEYIEGAAAKWPDAQFTLTKFDSEHLDTMPLTPITQVTPLTNETYIPGQMTPLYDAICRTINRVKTEVKAKAEVIFVIFTDGMENASREFKHSDALRMIQEAEKVGWATVFLGANIDSYATGMGMGINRSNTSNYESTADGIHVSMNVALASTERYYRTGSTKGLVSDEDRSKLEQKT